MLQAKGPTRAKVLGYEYVYHVKGKAGSPECVIGRKRNSDRR